MWLAYLDESGNTGKRRDDPDQPVHWLAALLVPEDQVIPLAAAVEAIPPPSGLGPTLPELHGSEMFSGRGVWKSVPIPERIRVVEAALSLLADHGCQISHASINKTKLRSDDYVPHILALQFLVQKLESHLRAQSDPLRQRALLVADETNEHDSFAIDLVRRMQNDHQSVFPHTGRPIDHIIDTVHFVRSEDNRGVQLADLVAFGLRRLHRPATKRGDETLLRIFQDHVFPLRVTWRETWPC